MPSQKILTTTLKTPFGELIIGSVNEELCLCDWKYRKQRNAIDDRLKRYFKADFTQGNSETISKTKSQLNEYFTGRRNKFDLPIVMAGTPFQKKVWLELLKIPFGETHSYLCLSKKLGNENAIRAVATANGANAISIIIPCHRIIGSNGELVGYAGGLKAKKELLALEGALNPSQLALF